MDQGAIWNMKWFYKNHFMMKLMNCNVSLQIFQKSFTVEDAMFLLTQLYDKVKAETFRRAWGNLYQGRVSVAESNVNKSETNCLEK